MLYYLGSIEGCRSKHSALHTFQYTFVKGRGNVHPKTREFLYDRPFDTSDMYEYEVPLGQDGFPELRGEVAPPHKHAVGLLYEVVEGREVEAFFKD